MIRKLVLGAAVLAVMIGGCTAASHLKALQPPAVPATRTILLPDYTPAARPPVPGHILRGIDVDLYTYPGQDFAAAAAATTAYVVSLHADALSVSFPFFMAGPRASAVYRTSATPTPGQLAVVARDARRAGLTVSLRPLLDEASLGRSRVGWKPARPAAWFASYRRFLKPYAAMAAREHVATLITGTEFSRFSRSPRWNALDSALRRVYPGTLACANNWGGTVFTGDCGTGVTETVDAYHPQHGSLLAGWETFDRALPPGTVETEVGIDAVAGAYWRPFRHSWPVTHLDQAVQAHWFTAACHAAAAAHLGGIYFWSLGFSDQAVTGPTLADQGSWAGGAGSRAISRCFAWMKRTGK